MDDERVFPALRSAGESVADPARPAVAISRTRPQATNRASIRNVPRSSERASIRDHLTGKTKFARGMDVTGAKPTVVARSPQIRGTVKSFGEAALRAMPGVIDVARIPTGVAIMAEMFGQALDAQEAVKTSYDKWEAP